MICFSIRYVKRKIPLRSYFDVEADGHYLEMRSPQRLSSSVNGIRSGVAVVQIECFQYRQRLGRDDQLAVPYKPRPVLPVDLRSLLQQLFLGCGLMVCVKSIPFLPYLTLVKVTVVLDWDATKSLERMHLTGRQNAGRRVGTAAPNAALAERSRT